MKEYLKLELEPGGASRFFQNALDVGNLLSASILEYVDFSEGKFFAITSIEADRTKISAFDVVELLPQQPVEKKIVLGREYGARRKSNSKKELAQYLHEALAGDASLICFFEDATRYASDPKIDIQDLKSFFHGKEVFFQLTRSASVSSILNAIQKTDSMWHFLCILTSAFVKEGVDQSFTKAKVKSICEQVRSIAIRAYDGEGYILWERTQP